MRYLLIFFAIFAAAVFYVLNDGESSSGTDDVIAGSPVFTGSYDAAMSMARSSGKPAVVIFSAHWCPPCQMMKKKVYPSAEVAPYKERFVWAYLDVDQASNLAAARKFSVEGIPAIFVLSPDGRELGRQQGGCDPAAFAAMLASCTGRQL